MSDVNINIVSGLALGIDTFAHLGCLKGKFGKTIAVLGNGLAINDIYPIENIKLFEKIIEAGGTILSEYIVGTKATKYNFPQRNRIISGIANKILVVEASQKSGSIITADFALEQGKEVFAVPGSIYKQTSKGTNTLILEGANVFISTKDLLK